MVTRKKIERMTWTAGEFVVGLTVFRQLGGSANGPRIEYAAEAARALVAAGFRERQANAVRGQLGKCIHNRWTPPMDRACRRALSGAGAYSDDAVLDFSQLDGARRKGLERAGIRLPSKFNGAGDIRQMELAPAALAPAHTLGESLAALASVKDLCRSGVFKSALVELSDGSLVNVTANNLEHSKEG